MDHHNSGDSPYEVILPKPNTILLTPITLDHKYSRTASISKQNSSEWTNRTCHKHI